MRRNISQDTDLVVSVRTQVLGVWAVEAEKEFAEPKLAQVRESGLHSVVFQVDPGCTYAH